MKKTSAEIRQDFIDYFKTIDHTYVPSAPVVPQDDPTLLFTNAGMNQFKDVFLETGTRPYNRAANSQKCIRVSGKHNDLEEVGHDNYHHTYFEMLGNWSFGDYFKREAIEWAWKLLTEVWKLPKERLYATVFAGDKADGTKPDTEAEQLWKEVTDIDPDHVIRFDKKDNFWEMGETGPCGPCSEIHIDMTDDLSGGDLVNADDERVIEIWNLVFIQYNRFPDGHLEQLPNKHVDTGMGFERIVRVLQGVGSNYDTDIFTPILDAIGKRVGIEYEKATEEQQIAFQVIADHIRMLTFSISDGALPSNEGRGYVLRRVLRRAARYGRKLNMQEPFIADIVPAVIDVNGEAFPEIVSKQDYIMDVIRSEEDSFNKTLDRGLELFSELTTSLKENNTKTIPGEDAFKLYDTYGFPLDLTRIMAEEIGMDVDEARFDQEMAEQKERARKAGKFSAETMDDCDWHMLVEDADPTFVGYNTLSNNTRIVKFARDAESYRIVLGESPFYAEAGGQVGDKGSLSTDGFNLAVSDTQKINGETVLICPASEDVDFGNGSVNASVDASLRLQTICNHTATHLLHAALREELGEHVQQAGSLVAPDYLRFDITHFKKVETDELSRIEKRVNDKIREDIALAIDFTDFDSAKERGAMALFGEKYGDEVRVVDISGFSTELCGGCHVQRTGEIGTFMITQESSVASGVRRIEAITGSKAVEFMQRSRDAVQQLGQTLNVRPADITNRVSELLEQQRNLEKELKKLQSGQVLSQIDQLISEGESLGSITLVTREFDDVEVNTLKELGDSIRQHAKDTVGFFVNRAGDRLNFVCAVTDDLIQGKKLKAGELVKQAAQLAGGGGGGRPHLATAGAKDASKLPDVYAFLKEHLQGLE